MSAEPPNITLYFSLDEMTLLAEEMEIAHPGISDESRALWQMEIASDAYNEAFWSVQGRALRFVTSHPLFKKRYGTQTSMAYGVTALLNELIRRA